MSKNLISVPASVVGMNPRVDRSWKLVFETRELSGEEVKLLADNFQAEGFLLFKPNEHISIDEVPEGDAETGSKTPSQRLRAVLYIWWQQKGAEGDFEAFYRVQMGKLVEYVKGQLSR